MVSIGKALARESPRLLWISVSAFEDEDSLRAALATLHEAAAAHHCALAIGGRALRDDIRKKLKYTFFGDGLAHLVSYAESLAARRPDLPETEFDLSDRPPTDENCSVDAPAPDDFA